MKTKPGILILLCLVVSCLGLSAQSTFTLSGQVSSSLDNQSIAAVSILIKGSSLGTFTDDKGNFKINYKGDLPVTLLFSSVGYDNKSVVVKSSAETLEVTLQPISALAQDVVVSASRLPERSLESPVTIEHLSLAKIRNAAAPSYYELIGQLKGVDLVTSSFAFKTPSTRGFNSSGNLRFNQLVDGMDNQAAVLNFSIGAIIGLAELDVESMELLPGASSALYGSGGMNGTLLINSKNPFKYQGLSVQVKQGVNHIDNQQHSAAPYYDYSLRYAKAVTQKLAFKVSGQYVKAQDWQATDRRNLLRNNVISSVKSGNRQTDPNYDGVNVYGDEASASMDALALAVRATVNATPQGAAGISGVDAMVGGGATPQQIANFYGSNPVTAPFVPYLPFLIPTSPAANNAYKNTFGGQSVSRTGYDEQYLVDYGTENAKVSAGINYKITEKLEALFLGYYGYGTSVYTGADRYVLKNFRVGQYKLELKSKNWFLRGYTTQENAGDLYTATTSALYINNAWKSNGDWFQQYTGVYGAGRLGILPGTGGTRLADEQAHMQHDPLQKTAVFYPVRPGLILHLQKRKPLKLVPMALSLPMSPAFTTTRGNTILPT